MGHPEDATLGVGTRKVPIVERKKCHGLHTLPHENEDDPALNISNEDALVHDLEETNPVDTKPSRRYYH